MLRKIAARARILLNIATFFTILAVSIYSTQIYFVANLIQVKADPSNTQVTVANSPPTFTVAPAENPASDSTTPTNVGSNVTFQATGTDPNSDNYFLAICKTNAITPGGPSAPTCDGGNWCISSSTTSGSQANCSYTALVTDNESEDWYAFVCDAVTGQTCSSSSQGSGSSGSPFKVNHRPTFTTITDGSADPGGTITFSATASDADIDGAQDQVKLFVCGDVGATGSGCTGTTLCSAILTNSNPSCMWTLPSVIDDGNYPYYSYIFDNHNLGAANNPFPGVEYTVNNVALTVSNVVINSGNPISLTENTSTAVPVTATISDNNSCQDISSVVTSLYRSSITFVNCDDNLENNNNFCYADVSCSVSGGSCTGGSDASADYSCTVNIQYHADPTDTTTQFDAQNWLATVEGTDGGSNVDTDESALGVELNSLIALNVTSSIAYGSLSPGSNSASPEQTTVTATGNVGIDTELSGTNMCTDFPTCSGSTIAVTQQEYDITTFSYNAGTDLTNSAVEVELNVLKTTVTASPQTKILYWAIGIPALQASGTYNGSNTITAVKSEVGEW